MRKHNLTRSGGRVVRGGVLVAAVLGLTVSVLGPAGAGGAEPADVELGGPAAARGGDSDQVTLITGDVVHWKVARNGQTSAVVEDDGDQSVFHTIESGDDYYVIPSEVEPLVGHQLDRELFNVATLVEQGYTDDAVTGIPVIVAEDARRSPSSTPPGLSVQRRLSSIDSLAGTVVRSKAEAFGDALAASVPASRKHGFGPSPMDDFDKVWLDQKLTVSLEDSVPQTGAPAAWAEGFDGTGTTVAVLDTGIDADHPDVAGQITDSKDFSGKGNVIDGYGHGTHVAATVAGTGDASDGLRKGVAPGADLVIGKVMDDEGGGSSSDIIAGMEWAATHEDVDVINMSLGGGPSDGTDPMSQALNELTEQNDVLFVVSAGNEGPGESTLSYPATADAALAVGAVDKQSELAWFSSRGPRQGDYGIKPEITAPGVGIKAARASGTSMGTPIDDLYTSADGTSMAAPHVAGAAAIVSQQHPNWDPETVKAALVNSATPHESLTPYEQGGGELNVAQAIHTSVVSTPSVLNMGYFAFPHDDAEPVTKTLTYTNHGRQATSVDLEAALTDEQGNQAPEGMISVQPSTLDLPAGASAEASVTVDRSLGGTGTYSGSLTAVGPGGERISATPIGFRKEIELYDLTIEAVQRNGEPASGSSTVAVQNVVDTSTFMRTSVEFVDGVAHVRVPPGTYNVMSMVFTNDPKTSAVQSQSLMGDPEVEVTGDVHLAFDARDAREITVDTPYDDVTSYGTTVQHYRKSSEFGALAQTWVDAPWPVYASPTEPVTVGEFNFGSKMELEAPGVWMNLAYPEFGAIPDDVSYEVTDENTARVDTAYHADTPGQEYARAGSATFPWEGTPFTQFRYFEAPLERTEIYSANETMYDQTVVAQPPFGPSLAELPARYEPGEHLKESWFASPNTPSQREGNEDTPGMLSTRLDNTLTLSIFEWGDQNPGEDVHYGFRTIDQDVTAARVYQDGELYATGERAFGPLAVDPESRLRIELDVAREKDFWTTSTRTKTAWEFDSATTTETEPLPLLQIEYDIPLDLNNRAAPPKDAPGPFTIGLDVRQPRGVEPTEIDEVKAWMSYDEGQTWRGRPVRATRDGFELVADRRGGGDHASLKVEARDADGNVVEQEVINAYKTRP